MAGDFKPQPRETTSKSSTGFYDFIVLSVMAVVAVWIFPPFALIGVVLASILYPRKAGVRDFLARVRFFARKRISNTKLLFLLLAGVVLAILATILCLAGSMPGITDFINGLSAGQLKWLISAGIYALSGCLIGAWVCLLARPPRKVGVAL